MRLPDLSGSDQQHVRNPRRRSATHGYTYRRSLNRIPGCYNVASISANADGPRDAASCKIDHIALHAECNHRKQASVDIESTLLHRPTAADYSSTYVHVEAQTPLGRRIYYKTNTQQIELMEIEHWRIASLASIVLGASNRSPPSTALLTSINGMPKRIFSF